MVRKPLVQMFAEFKVFWCWMSVEGWTSFTTWMCWMLHGDDDVLSFVAASATNNNTVGTVNRETQSRICVPFHSTFPCISSFNIFLSDFGRWKTWIWVMRPTATRCHDYATMARNYVAMADKPAYSGHALWLRKAGREVSWQVLTIFDHKGANAACSLHLNDLK